MNWIIVVMGGFFLLLTTLASPAKHRFHIDIGHDALGSMILATWTFLYYFVFEALFGRTLGELITRTKVIDRQGRKPTPRVIALRTLCRLAPFEPLSACQASQTCWHDD